MHPTPPWALKPRAVPSSPESWMNLIARQQALPRRPRKIGGSILGADDVGAVPGKPGQGFRADVGHRSGRDVVDENGNVDRLGDGPEMRVEPFLGRLVVIGNDDERGVGPGLVGMARVFHRLGGVVRSRSGDHRHAARRRFDGEFDNALVLLLRKRRRFPGGTDRNEAMRRPP